MKMKKLSLFFKIVVLILLFLWFFFLIAHQIDLTTADLGRHLKNGELILKGEGGILNKNFYSYTHPLYPVINHHWVSGTVFFLVQKLFGFLGLHLFFLVLSLTTFFLFFRISQKQAGFFLSFLATLLVIPLLAQRAEVRPEVFTYFFSAVFFWILWHYQKNTLRSQWLFLLPALQILWVNSHIYFFIGPILVGVFLLERLICKKSIKILSLILLFSILACFFNPFGARGIFYPLLIWKNYGYQIVENQSVRFLDKLGFIQNPNLLIFKIVFSLLVLSFILAFIRHKRCPSISNLLLTGGFSTLAWLALRNFTLFGFFTLPILATNLKLVLPSKIQFDYSLKNFAPLGLIAFILIVATLGNYQYYSLHKNNLGLGLQEGNNQAAELFQKENIQGPIFNNYDIGSYLIYYLFPENKVFVDNRPEAYPASFFQKTYIPMQEDRKVWEKQDAQYNFNAIFFAYHDATPWAQKFLIERVDDLTWAPVFVDQYAIIFLKRNAQNQEVIKKYEIPREYFGTKNNSL